LAFAFVAKKLEEVALARVVFPAVAVSVPPTTTLPAVSMVVVAVPPKYARYAEKSVDDAFENCWSAVQVLAFAVLSESVPAEPPTSAPKVPLYESDEPIVAVVVATEVSEPTPEAYTSCPVVKFDVVERPFHEIVGVVPPDEMIGQVPETEVTTEPGAT